MLNKNNSKIYTIVDNSKKYNDINQRIIKETKLFDKTMKNHSFQISQIENKLNEYSIKNNIKIRQLLENQQKIIKELVNIINQIITKKSVSDATSLQNDDKSEKSFIKHDIKYRKDKNITNMKINIHPSHSIDKNFYINEIKKIISKKNYFKNQNKKSNTLNRNLNKRNCKSNINYKNIISLNNDSIKSINELKNNSDLINIKYLNKNNNKFGKKYLNKLQIQKEIDLSNKKLFKSMSENEISNKPKILNNTLYIQTNSLNNSKLCNLNANYTIDEERNIFSFNNEQERQTSLYNKTDIDGSLPNLLSKHKMKKKAKYRSLKNIRVKEEFYFINNYTFTNFNITNSSSQKSIDNTYYRNNNSLTYMNSDINTLFKNNKSLKNIGKKIYSMPYINNGIQIIPTRATKEVLSNSYKIVDKYRNRSKGLKKFI